MRKPSLWFTVVSPPAQPRDPPTLERLVEAVGSFRTTSKGVTLEQIREERLAATWLLEALYQCSNSIPPTPLALPLSKGTFNQATKSGWHFGVGSANRVLRAAERLKWVAIKRGTSFGKDSGTVSLIEAKGTLRDTLLRVPNEWTRIQSPPLSNLLLIAEDGGGRKRRLVGPNEGPRVIQWQQNLYRINEFLAGNCIYLNASNERIRAASAAMSAKAIRDRAPHVPTLNFLQTSLRRIFSRGRLDYGGRFYGGWWQAVPKAYRPLIGINCERTVELDYSGMALSCLYAMERLDIGDADPYDIGLNFTDKQDPRRKVVKKFVNASLNDKAGRYRPSSAELRQLGISLRELKQRVCERHKPVARYFNTDIGLHLQFLDSEIAEGVMLRCMDLGIVCLPIHDSFVVDRLQASQVWQIMQEVYEGRFGVKPSIDIELSAWEEGVGMPDPDSILLNLPAENPGNAARKIYFARNSIALDFYASWKLATTSPEQLEADHQEKMRWYATHRHLIERKVAEEEARDRAERGL